MSLGAKAASLLLLLCGATANCAHAQGNALGSISGSVQDQSNKPVPGLHVAVTAAFPQLAARVLTDDHGTFRFSGLRPGNYYVLIVARGLPLAPPLPGVSQFDYRGIYYPHATSLKDAQIVTVRPGEQTSNIRFTVDSSTYKIAGTVVEAGNLGGVSLYEGSIFLLEVHRAGWNRLDEQVLGGPPTFYVLARLDGGFELRGFPRGEFTIAVRRRLGSPNGVFSPYIGYTSVRIVDRDAPIEIPVDGTGDVRGKVVWDGVKPDPTIGILQSGMPFEAILQSEVWYNKRSVGSIDETGSFSIANVEAGFPYTLRVALPQEYSSYSQRVHCGGRDYTNQPLTVEPGATLTDCIVNLGSTP